MCEKEKVKSEAYHPLLLINTKYCCLYLCERSLRNVASISNVCSCMPVSPWLHSGTEMTAKLNVSNDSLTPTGFMLYNVREICKIIMEFENLLYFPF